MVEPADWLLTRVERGSNPRTRIDELHGDRAWSEGNHAVRGSAARRTSAVHGAIEATGPGDLVVFPDCQGDADERPSPAARWSRCCPARTSEASRLGIAAKGRRDCGRHEWYREHDDVWRCYHCEPGEYVGEDPYVNEALRDLG